MTKRFYLTLVLAFLLFSASIAFVVVYSAPVTPQATPTRYQFDKFTAPEEEGRLKQGVNGSAGVSNPLAPPQANVPSHVPTPQYAPGGSARSDGLPKTDLPVPPQFTNPLLGNK